jgi:hypothetical protein
MKSDRTEHLSAPVAQRDARANALELPPEKLQLPDDFRAAVPHARLHFTGTGAENFRIWIVQLLLTQLKRVVYSE